MVTKAMSEGFTLAMVTLTLRHDRGQRLRPLWDSLAGCWKGATTGRPWAADSERFGLVGYVKAVEVTHGQNGWHPHVHAVLVLAPGLSDGDIEALCNGMWSRWAAGAVRKGLRSPLLAASEWHRLSESAAAGTALADYLAKGVMSAGAIGMELTQTQSKVARSVHSTRSLWEVARAAVENGEVADVKVWQEWELGSKGRRQIAWTKGLRERFGVGIEEDDETIAGEEAGCESDTVCWITRKGWSAVISRPYLAPLILDVLEAQGWPGLERLLVENGIDFERVTV